MSNVSNLELEVLVSGAASQGLKEEVNEICVRPYKEERNQEML